MNQTEKIEAEEPHITAQTGNSEDTLFDPEEQNEVFQKKSDGVDFRTLKWPMATVIFLKRTSPCAPHIFHFTN